MADQVRPADAGTSPSPTRTRPPATGMSTLSSPGCARPRRSPRLRASPATPPPRCCRAWSPRGAWTARRRGGRSRTCRPERDASVGRYPWEGKVPTDRPLHLSVNSLPRETHRPTDQLAGEVPGFRRACTRRSSRSSRAPRKRAGPAPNEPVPRTAKARRSGEDDALSLVHHLTDVACPPWTGGAWQLPASKETRANQRAQKLHLRTFLRSS